MVLETIFDVPLSLVEFGVCACLQEVESFSARDLPRERLRNEYGERRVTLHNTYHNAAVNCYHCHGTGLDKDRLQGALLRLLSSRISLIRFERRRGTVTVRFRHEGKEWHERCESLLDALIAVWQIISAGENGIILHQLLEPLEGTNAAENSVCAYCHEAAERHIS